MSVRTYYLIFVLWNTSCVFLCPRLYLTNWDKLQIVDWNVWTFKNWQWCELCHYSVTWNVPVHNIHHKAPVHLYHPHLLTSSGRRDSGVLVLTFPRAFSKPSPQTTLAAWQSCPSHYCAAAVVESAYCGMVIVQSLSSGASGDMWHSTGVTETHFCIVFTS